MNRLVELLLHWRNTVLATAGAAAPALEHMQPGAGTATATTATLLNGFLSDLGDKQTHAELDRLANDLQTIKAEYVSLEAYFDLFGRELRKHLLFLLDGEFARKG